MNSLTGGQKRSLKSQAHHLKPVVMIGKLGITDSLVEAVNAALDDHELIKMKFIDFKDKKNDLVAEIVRRTGSESVDIIGNIAIIYKQNKDSKKRRIVV
jgi:RNA-binding protein